MRTRTFSTQAWDFANEMLADHPYIARRKIDVLAGLLQEVLEEFIADESGREPPGPLTTGQAP